jgi:hypothetical protein
MTASTLKPAIKTLPLSLPLCSLRPSRNVHKTSIRITTDRVKTYYLDNNGECFRNAVQSEAVRRWVERTIDEGEDIYFVVGYRTIVDARVAAHIGGQVELGGKLVMPVSGSIGRHRCGRAVQ